MDPGVGEPAGSDGSDGLGGGASSARKQPAGMLMKPARIRARDGMERGEDLMSTGEGVEGQTGQGKLTIVESENATL